MAGQRHILVIDDDAELRATLRRPLIGEGYTVSEAGSAAEAQRLACDPKKRFDLLILDLRLPDGDGRDLCAVLRRHGVQVPVLLLSGVGDEAEMVQALDSGANDYVVKPFRTGELLARLRALLRAHDISEDAELPLGRFRFRPNDRVLIDLDGRRLSLTAKEAAMLKYLLRAQGAVSRAELLRHVWGYSAEATTHTVETHVYRLRQKLEPEPRRLRVLLNESNGYRLYPNGVPVGESESSGAGRG